MTYIVSFDEDKYYWLGQLVPYLDLYVIEWSGWNYSKTFNPHAFRVSDDTDTHTTINDALTKLNSNRQQTYIVSSLDPFRNATSYEDFIAIFQELYPEYLI